MTAVGAGAFERLRGLLDELFQFDQADLDFGIYRLMGQRRDEIRQFLDRELLPQVGAALGDYEAGERAALESKAKTLRERAVQLELAPEDVPAYRDVQDQLARLGDRAALEGEVYSDLYQFFRRYYKDGDFLSLRRYREGVYAIPYEGEEVKLHWANADQYYVKTAEQFQEYRFTLADGRAVWFHLAAAGGERDNNKATEGRERHFALREERPVEAVGDELRIAFEYRPRAERQAALNAATTAAILADPAAAGWAAALREARPTAATPGRTLLDQHLARYTARNSFDYFIHKDLGGFLRRELDHYLKTDILRLDDLEGADERGAGRALARLRAIRRIGDKIITFLAQLEDFQKRLFLKRKFVLMRGGG